MLDLTDIGSFLEVVQSGGFARAADRLGVSKSIVSRRISRLEEELETRLLTRTTRGISPTEAGLQFQDKAQRIMDDLEEARELVSRQGNGISGRLRVAAPLSFGSRHVAPLLAELADTHPALEIDATFSDKVIDLVSEGVDVGIRIGQLKDSSLIARKIAPVRQAVLGSPDYLARHGVPATPADLAGHRCILYSGGNILEWRFKQGSRWIAVRPKGRLRADSSDAILPWLEGGLGLAAVPTFMISDAVRAGRLRPVLEQYAMPEAGLYVVRPQGQHVTGKVRAFVDAAVERFSGVLSWDPCRAAPGQAAAYSDVS